MRQSLASELLNFGNIPRGKIRPQIVTDPAIESPSMPARRFPLRFSLRTTLLATTLLCVWLGWHWQATRRQQRAVETIRAAGGWVAYDYAWQDER
jgi:hypothetical protein